MSYTVSTIKSCDLWDLYLSDSCQNSFYMKASLLQRLDHTVIFKCVKKGNEVLGLFPLAGGGAHLPHIYYYGMSYMNRINELSSSNQIDQTIQIQQAICKCILANIEKVCLSLSTQISDIRGLSWSNFDDPDLNLMIEPKYTHIIDLKDKTFENLMQSFKGVRRQEIRYATEREDLIVTADDDIDALLASLNEPVIESDADLEEKAAVQAQIAAELDDDTSSEESTSDDESLDDDINTLLGKEY